ncbi:MULTISPECIES: DNA-binding protein [unclassified Nocardia]|uniref:DNA-binding protein n=1 Tax=unclassified Nocardia TaxID=2637762 RepID=UPI001CE44A92|nr:MULTISPECIES: DNA-binding protein [unclassified Nocardia]
MTESDLPVKLSRPARRALDAAGIRCLADLTTWTERDLAALHGIGPTAVDALRAALAERGLNFA